MSKFLDDLRHEAFTEINDTIGKALYKGYQEAVVSTAVDTGQLRASWILNRDGSGVSTVRSRPTNHRHGVDIFPSRLSTNRSKSKRYSKAFDITKVKTSYLVNNIPYASYMDDRDNMVAKAIIKIERNVR